MLFKNPSVLYALLALLIPILIHLFKLRKFQKTAFTNVAFLEKIKIQSRKSSKLKKWLILFSRLLIFTFLIFAFALPYLPSASKTQKPEQYIIYLDNSFSMQAKGANGELLKRAVQDIIENFNNGETFSLFTNTEVFENIQLEEAQNDILEIDYSAEQLSPEQIVFKAKKLAKNIPNSAFIYISDFQKRNHFNYSSLRDIAASYIQLKPEQIQNIAIDSLWLTTVEDEKTLNIATSTSNSSENPSLSVFNNDALIGKATLDFTNTKTQITEVPLPKNTNIIGTVSIESNEGLPYDDIRFFSINELPKSKVLVVGSVFNQFLQKIYTADEFDFMSTTIANFNPKEIANTNVIILNEIEAFPKDLEQALINFTKQGGTLCIIPSSKSPSEIAAFLTNNYNISIGDYIKTSKKLTQISYSHPLFKDVFSKESINFQYPTIKESYQLDYKNWALSMEDNTPFLVQNNSVFVFASPLNESISNFKNSPLVVPTFYNIAKQNTTINTISYNLGASNIYDVKASANQDEVITLKSSTEEFIPLQQIFKNYIRVSTDEYPKKAGNYTAFLNNKSVYNVSYNYNSEESKLVYEQFPKDSSLNFKESLDDFFQSTKADFQTTDLWKWFLIFALFFLVVEILLIKFLK